MPECTENNVKAEVMLWLRNALDRNGGRQKRAAKKQQEGEIINNE